MPRFSAIIQSYELSSIKITDMNTFLRIVSVPDPLHTTKKKKNQE